MNDNHSQPSALARPADNLATKTLKDLQARLWHFESVGLGNCQAAQRTRRELNEQLLIQSAVLTNANFNTNELRDWHGRWATNASGTATNKPAHANTAHRPDHTGTKPNASGATSGTKPAPIALPPAEKISLSTNEPALMLERLLLSETMGAEEHGFVQADALKNIRAIGALIYNRAHTRELGFTSFSYPANLLDVIKQGGQFRGFEDYNPKTANGGLSNKRLQRIDVWIQGANDPKDKKNYANYLAVVKQVKATAQNILKGKIDDPFSPCFTFGVRTAGHGGPGGSFQYLGTAAGNNFYGFPPPKPKGNQVHP